MTKLLKQTIERDKFHSTINNVSSLINPDQLFNRKVPILGLLHDEQ